MKRHFDIGLIELAMRVVERVRIAAARNPSFIMSDLVAGIVDDFGCAESTAFRHVRAAVDVLGIHYDANPCRQAVKRRRQQDAAYQGQRDASSKGWPNGRPGRADSLDQQKRNAQQPAEHA